MWEPAFSLYTCNCQPNPTSCKLLNSDLLFSILTAITWVQAPISSRLDYCFLSYFVHIQSIFCTIAVVLWLLSLLLKHPSITHLQYKFFINIQQALLHVLVPFYYNNLISHLAPLYFLYSSDHFPGMFHEHIHTSSSASGALSAQYALINLENTSVSLKTRLRHSPL